MTSPWVRSINLARKVGQPFQNLVGRAGTPTSFAGGGEFNTQISSEYLEMKALAQRLNLKP